MDNINNYRTVLSPKLPLVKQWINTTLSQHSASVQGILNFNFPKVNDCFSPEIIKITKVVIVDKVPVPPLSQLGLGQLDGFESGDYAGITFIDTYFLSAKYSSLEALHFHELVHIVQWQHLGVDRFLLIYGMGLLQFGYFNSPLEVMAYEYQKKFEQNLFTRGIEDDIKTKIDALAGALAI
jgi:hypothetical protein